MICRILFAKQSIQGAGLATNVTENRASGLWGNHGTAAHCAQRLSRIGVMGHS
jgi:hypothetical protein